jgi:hypothetical protein
MGILPSHAQRITWTLVTAKSSAFLRVESQSSVRNLSHLNRESVQASEWQPPTRAEYSGAAAPATPPFKLVLQKTLGKGQPEMTLACTSKTIDVHPAFVTLVEGWARPDDMNEPASWAPPRTESVRVLYCRPPEGVQSIHIGESSFGEGLAFAAARAATSREPEASGVEFAFVNSDMVIQQGGYRWAPTFSFSNAP